ncbi:MAG: Non-ribosomal peptide synthetase [Actinomycetia bacterium]|nr:Non-ribosomal peptide synthetase [Actinomycetes bacterium]
MVHTFAGADDAEVRETVREQFTVYLESSIDLWKSQLEELREPDRAKLAQYAFERYYRTAAMFGSVDRCARFAGRLADAGVDEVASLIDFGLPGPTVLSALPYLDQVRARIQDR